MKNWVLDLEGERYKEMLSDCFSFELPLGWKPLFLGLAEVLLQENVKVLQVKEKFGQLTVYLNEYPNDLMQLTRDIEALSETICLWCGCPAEVTTKGYITNVCMGCSEK